MGLARSGHPDEQIGGVLDISAGLVAKWRRVHGVPAAARSRYQYEAITSDRIRAANDMRYAGIRPEVIAKRLGVSRRSVYRMLRPELKTGDKTYSATTLERLAKHMREKVQPLGAASERTWHEGRARLLEYREQVWLENHGRGQGEHHGGENPT